MLCFLSQEKCLNYLSFVFWNCRRLSVELVLFIFIEPFQFEDLCLYCWKYFSTFYGFLPSIFSILSPFLAYLLIGCWNSLFDPQPLLPLFLYTTGFSYSLMIPFFGNIFLDVPEDISEISFSVFFYCMSYIASSRFRLFCLCGFCCFAV